MSLLVKVTVVSSLCVGTVGLLGGCAAPVTTQAPAPASNGLVITPSMTSSATPPYNGGGYYKDDGPGANPPAHLESIPDAVPRKEPMHRYANDPYRVMGVLYTPDTSGRAYKQKGLASWYGRKFHGKATASGEPYDMYGMTAAHRTLPIPSFVRVTNVENGRSVVLRVNDRGPFHNDRMIDLSYTAAYKLDILKGVTRVEVERIDPSEAPEPAPLAEPIRIYKAQEPAVIRGQSLPAEVAKAAPDSIWLQLGAFGRRETADQLMQQAGQTLGSSLVIQREGGGLIRVQAGPFTSPAEADRASQMLSERMGLRPYRVAEPKTAVAEKVAADKVADKVAEKAAVTKPSVSVETVSAAPTVAPAAVTPVPVAAAPAPGLYLQVGAVSKAEAAEALIGRMGTAAGSAVHRIESGALIKIQTGPFATPAQADEAAAALEKILGVKPFRVTR